jgi:hypothetical protein
MLSVIMLNATMLRVSAPQILLCQGLLFRVRGHLVNLTLFQ